MSAFRMRQFIDLVETTVLSLDEQLDPAMADWRHQAQARNLAVMFIRTPKFSALVKQASEGGRHAQIKLGHLAQKHITKLNTSLNYKMDNTDVQEIIECMLHMIEHEFEHLLSRAAKNDDDPEWVTKLRTERAAEEAAKQIAAKYHLSPQAVVEKIREISQRFGKPANVILARIAQKAGITQPAEQ